MAIPLVVIVPIGIALLGGGTAAAIKWALDPDLEDVIDAVKGSWHNNLIGHSEANTGAYWMACNSYMACFPSHSEDHFKLYLMYFLAGIVCMRKLGTLSYSDYANPTQKVYGKIYNTYLFNEKLPDYELIRNSFDVVSAAYELEQGKKHLVSAENQGFVDSLMNAWQYGDKLVELQTENPELANQYAEKWIEENATTDAAVEKLNENIDNALNAVAKPFGSLLTGNTALIAFIAIGALFITFKRS